MAQFSENDEIKTLTVNELRQFEGLGHLSDEQAHEIVETLKTLTLITHKIVANYEQSASVPKLRKT